MSDNHLTGPIPSCIGDMTDLTSLYLSRNQMSGTLPSSVGDLRKLTLIDVSSNGFYGTVPSSIADWENVMVEFSLCYNKFSSFENGLESFSTGSRTTAATSTAIRGPVRSQATSPPTAVPCAPSATRAPSTRTAASVSRTSGVAGVTRAQLPRRNC